MKIRHLYLPLLLALLLQLSASAKSRRPNIILFIVDDMGWQDTSVPFWDQRTRYNDLFETPNMERLAARGMLFTSAYGCSLSSATRCSLLTGANNARHRVTNWTLERDTTTDIESATMQVPEWNYNGIAQVGGINNTFVGTSFVELLRRSGYHTIHVGKAHFGAIDTPGESPNHFGFEVNIAGHAAGGLATYYSEKNYGHSDDGTPYSLFAVPDLEQYWGSGLFATEALTREALKALDKAKRYAQPFFLYMAHYAVHVPVDRDPRYYDKYIAKGLGEKDAAYASLVEGMDKSLGDLMQWVDENGEADNTVILMVSDNGGLATAPAWRDGEIFTQNYPLYSGKGSLLEGGIRVPMIVSWPGEVEAGSRCDGYLLPEDFFPSLLEIAGVTDYTVPQQIDGISFVPLLRRTAAPDRTRPLIWNYPNVWGNDGPGINLNCAIRKGDWKLIYYYETGAFSLFNVTEDISEQHDLATERPDLVRSLATELGRLLRARGGQRPSFKSTGLPAPWPDDLFQ